MNVYNQIQDEVDAAIAADGRPTAIRPSESGDTAVVIYSAYDTDNSGEPINNLHDIAAHGKVILIGHADEFYGGKESTDYRSEVLESPTWLVVAVHANLMIGTTRDYHHCFLEGLYAHGTDGDITIYEFAMGS